MARRLHALWLAACAPPILVFLADGRMAKTLAVAAVWLAGTLLLEVASRRDPQARALAELRASPTGLLVAAMALVSVQSAVLLLPGSLVVFAALLAALGFLALWCLFGPSARPAKTVRLGALVLAGAAVFVVGGEVVSRLPFVLASTGGHRPGIERWKREHYDFLWQRNPFGLRSLHLDDPKPAGVREILVLGDEASFGTLVARTEDTWPYVLERDLTREGLAVRVVNAAREGFTTANEAEWLTRMGFRFDPDLLIVQFGMNDAVPSRPNFGAERSFWFHRLRPLLPGLHNFLESRSYLYSALDSFKEHQEMRWLHPEGFNPIYEDDMLGWQQSREALATMGAWARARGVPALLAIFPDLEPDTRLAAGAYRYEAVHEKVRRAAEAAGFTVVDLFPVFAAQGRPPEAWWTLPCEPLPGDEAQRLAAGAIRRAIDAGGLLGRASGGGVRQ